MYVDSICVARSQSEFSMFPQSDSKVHVLEVA